MEPYVFFPYMDFMIWAGTTLPLPLQHLPCKWRWQMGLSEKLVSVKETA